MDSEVALALEGRFDDEETSVPPVEGEVRVQHSEAAGSQESDDIPGNTGNAEDAVRSEDAATTQLDDAEVSTLEQNKLAPMVNAEALANWIFEQRDNFKSLLSTPNMFVRTVMNAMDKSGMRATRQVVADSVNHLAALLAHTDTLIDLDTMFVVPFTKVCLRCGAALETNHRSATASKTLIGHPTATKLVSRKMRCPHCPIIYAYGAGTLDEERFKVNSPLPHVVVSQDLVYIRQYLEKLEGREVFRHVSMYSEELLEDRGTEGKALRLALNAYWAFKYIHMYERHGIVSLKPANPNDSWIITVMRRVRNHIRDVGYPHRDHDCVASGPTHVPLKKGCDKAALLAKMAVTIIVGGNMKACYKICQHQYGERYIEATGLSLPSHCKASRSRGSLYCPEHAPLQGGNHLDEDGSIFTRTRLHAKLGKDEGACQKTHTQFMQDTVRVFWEHFAHVGCVLGGTDSQRRRVKMRSHISCIP